MAQQEVLGLTRSIRTGWSLRFGERQIFTGLTLLVVVWLVLAPVSLVVICSFLVEPLRDFQNFSLTHYAKIYLDAGTYKLLWNTVSLAVGAIGTGFLFALPLAWLVERTNTPGRNSMYMLILVPMAIPPMISALGWERLLGPRIGLINVFLRWLLDLKGEGPLNVFTIYGMAVVMGLSSVPTLFLILAPVFRNLDPAFEEASVVSGAGRWKTFLRVTMPLASPAVFAALIWAFVLALEAFEIPGVLGLQAGILVFSTKIFWAVAPPTGELPDYGMASALSIFVLILSSLLVYVYLRMLGAGEKYTSVTGKGYRPVRVDLGRWRYLGICFFGVYIVLAIVLPLAVLIWGSLLHYYQLPSWTLLKQISLQNYLSILDSPYTLEAIRNTAILVFTAATVTTLLCAVIAWVIIRFRGIWGRTVNVLSFSPIAIPTVIIGFAMVLTYIAFPIGIYGTVWIIVIAHVTRYMSYGSRAMIAAQVQVHSELEEASYTFGASLLTTFRRIILPIVVPAVVSLWLWVALHSLRELTAAVLLSTPDNQVVSTLIWNSYYEGEVGIAYALSVMLILVSLVLAFAARKLLVGREAT